MYAPAPLRRQLNRSGLLLLGPAFVAAVAYVAPLVGLTASRRVMGDFVNRWATTLAACLVATAVSVLNVVLIVLTFRG
jgi:Mn2+/Fe2+ NRAMP family transporter